VVECLDTDCIRGQRRTRRCRWAEAREAAGLRLVHARRSSQVSRPASTMAACHGPGKTGPVSRAHHGAYSKATVKQTQIALRYKPGGSPHQTTWQQKHQSTLILPNSCPIRGPGQRRPALPGSPAAGLRRTFLSPPVAPLSLHSSCVCFSRPARWLLCFFDTATCTLHCPEACVWPGPHGAYV
jgi:hypothetical protein